MLASEVKRLAQKVSTMSLVFLIANNYQLYCENNADVIVRDGDIFFSAMWGKMFGKSDSTPPFPLHTLRGGNSRQIK